MIRAFRTLSTSVLGSVLVLAAGIPFDGAFAAATYSELYSLQGRPDGAFPIGGVISDASGNLYGTTYYGGANEAGSIVKVTPGGGESVLYSFCNQPNCADGSTPFASMIFDKSGNLYGTTMDGGANSVGAVYKLAPDGTETVLYSFKNTGGDGGGPQGKLLLDSRGNLWGTTSAGGASGNGTVFRLAPNGTETVIYSFKGGSDGGAPLAGLIRDSKGNFYGTTSEGFGTVFKLTAKGKETVLYPFTGGTDGSSPTDTLVMDAAGNVYGTTQAGGGTNCALGTGGCGVVFEVTPTGTESVLYAFTGGSDGGNPYGGLIFDKAGNLYGTTRFDGTGNNGTVFKLTPNSTFTVLHSFGGLPNDGSNPDGTLIAKKGELFGTTQLGGSANGGTVFEVKE